jgi:FixJ family two-component response regulator
MGGDASSVARADAVLLVEDDDATRALLAREIADVGHTVRAVQDAPSALAAMAEQPANIVVADIYLRGGMDGVRLCAAIREAHPFTEVILLTGFPTLSTAIEGVKLGACDYLLKPFEDLADLRRSLVKASARIASRIGERELVARLRARTGGQEALLDRLPTAIVLADVERRIHGSNRAGELLLAAGAGLRLDPDGRLRASRPAEDLALGEALAACAPAHGGGIAVAISRDPGLPPLRAVVCSLRAGVLDEPSPVPLAALVVAAPERSGVSPDAEILARLYGLTPAEGALTARLVAGESVQEACEHLGIALATARTHLSRIFSKTGTTRQADLVGLVLTGPALLATGAEAVGRRA